MTSQTRRSEQKQQHEALTGEIADLLLSADSPVRNQEAFQQFLDEHDRSTARQVELNALDGKLVEVIAGTGEEHHHQMPRLQNKIHRRLGDREII
jgi:hypothetical protein